MLGPLPAALEDQEAEVPRAQIAGTLEPKRLAALERHPGKRGLGRNELAQLDRCDAAEGDGVVDPLRWRIERLGGLALVEVEDQPAGKPAAGPGDDAARDRAAGREVVVAGAGAAGAEVDALEGS